MTGQRWGIFAVGATAAVAGLIAFFVQSSRERESAEERLLEASDSHARAIASSRPVVPTKPDAAAALRKKIQEEMAAQSEHPDHDRDKRRGRDLPAGADPNLPPLPGVLPGLPNNAVGRGITSFVRASHGVGPNAEKRYQASLEQLRHEDPKEVVQALKGAYEKMPAEAYMEREAIVSTAAALESHEAAELLVDAATEPVAGKTDTDHGVSPLMEEGVIRYAAIDGLETLARQGNTQAEAALAELIATGHPTVVRAATMAYIQSGPNRVERQEAALALLPESQRSIVQRERIDFSLTRQEAPVEGAQKPGSERGAKISFPTASADTGSQPGQSGSGKNSANSNPSNGQPSPEAHGDDHQ